MNRVKLSKTVSYILRHNPRDFGLELAADGSVSLQELTEALRDKFQGLDEDDLIDLVRNICRLNRVFLNYHLELS